MLIRIDRLLSQLKYGSRTEMQRLIVSGHVKRNGVVITTPRLKVDPEADVIEIDQEQVFFRFRTVLMMNKPKGVISANRDGFHKTAIGIVGPPYDRFNLNIAGRLDLDAEGLLLLTNDGKLLHQIISPNHEISKVYHVRTDKNLGNLKDLETGVEILDGQNVRYLTKPAKVRIIDNRECEITIHEGKFHQVKRMFAAVGYEVIHLKRMAIGSLELDPGLAPGEYRELDDAEIARIFAQNPGPL